MPVNTGQRRSTQVNAGQRAPVNVRPSNHAESTYLFEQQVQFGASLEAAAVNCINHTTTPAAHWYAAFGTVACGKIVLAAAEQAGPEGVDLCMDLHV